MSGVTSVPDVQPNQSIPPGGGAPADEDAPSPSETDGESESTTTETNAETGQAAAPEVKAKRQSGPRKLNADERKALQFILDQIADDEPVTEKQIPYSSLDMHTKYMISYRVKNNLIQRELLKAEMDPATGGVVSVTMTSAGWDLWSKPDETAAKAKTPKAKVSKAPKETSEFRNRYDNPHHRLRKLTETNPRQEGTHGHNSWNLYQDGMTYKEYMDSKFDNTLVNKKGTPFDGPRGDHFLWDIAHGKIGMFDDREEEQLPDGSPNPKFWVMKL